MAGDWTCACVHEHVLMKQSGRLCTGEIIKIAWKM